MNSGRGGMGISKHGKSGHAGKSPKFRHAMKRQAEAMERKSTRPTLTAERMGQLLRT